MFRRVTFLFAILILVSSMSFGISSGCSNFYCFSLDEENDYCYAPLPQGGLGDLVACTTVWNCNGAGDCTTFCRSTFCYYV
jgi:hypothetical protein